MCLAKVFTEKDEQNPVLENVTLIIPDQNEVKVETLFGKKKIFQAKITRINFTDSKVTLKLL